MSSGAPAGTAAGTAAPADGARARLAGAREHSVAAAPMMNWSDRHCRRFFRVLAPRARLYTEMIVAQAIVRGDAARLLEFDPAEHPVALQLGGSDPRSLAAAARLGAARGYDEINLNVGCPSDRVQGATFGACLMAYPARVAAGVAAMRAAVDVPVTVKCRIGIDDRDQYEFLRDFVAAVAAAGCGTFIVHARKAVLHGLSPRENRQIPPLCYDTVWRLKRERPDLVIVINGGIRDLATAREQWRHVDGVMVGREAYHNPYFLAALEAEARAGDAVAGIPDVARDAGEVRVPGRLPALPAAPPTPREAVATMRPYIEAQLARGVRLHAITRHMLGLYAGRPGARAWRRVLSELGTRPGAGCEVLEQATAAAETGGGGS